MTFQIAWYYEDRKNERVVFTDNQREELSYGGAEKTRYYLKNSERYIEIDESDLNFPARISDVRQKVLKYEGYLKEKYKIASIDELGKINTGNPEEDIEELRKADKFIKEQLNYAFQYNVSEPAFGEASCLSPAENGEMYFESFYNSVLAVIEKKFGRRLEKFNKHIKKYTDKKNIHPALKK